MGMNQNDKNAFRGNVLNAVNENLIQFGEVAPITGGTAIRLPSGEVAVVSVTVKSEGYDFDAAVADFNKKAEEKARKAAEKAAKASA